MLVTTFTVLALTASAVAPPAIEPAPVHPYDLVTEIANEAPDRVTIDATFRLNTATEPPGALHVDIVDGMVGSEFSVNGETHVLVQQIDGEEPEVWYSPEIEADPELMRGYWGVLSDLTLEPEVAGKNPACGVTKWGLRTLAIIANVACCRLGGGIACGLCTIGYRSADGAIEGIDCNKECKPDCPIP